MDRFNGVSCDVGSEQAKERRERVLSKRKEAEAVDGPLDREDHHFKQCERLFVCEWLLCLKLGRWKEKPHLQTSGGKYSTRFMTLMNKKKEPSGKVKMNCKQRPVCIKY